MKTNVMYLYNLLQIGNHHTYHYHNYCFLLTVNHETFLASFCDMNSFCDIKQRALLFSIDCSSVDNIHGVTVPGIFVYSGYISFVHQLL